MLTETYRAMVQEWYFKRQEVADWVADKVQKRKIKSTAWVVNGVNQYQALDGRYNREVNFMNGSCEYRKWQLSGIPCGHVIAVTRFLGLTDCVQFVADWFKKERYQGTYAVSNHFVRDIKEWEFPSNIHHAIPPRIDNPQPGLVPLANAIQDSESILTYTQIYRNQLHVYVSRVELSPLVVADEYKDEGNKKEKQD
ncbi:hypothetical protein Tco_0839570 [Tanacetum coccineum]|uniref:Zinc finger PMZ-type domain-containing protein n=1 Tax=Tanacetum coccineum TaxID=301880 RepID=A0ABQ5ARV7_9ASTR